MSEELDADESVDLYPYVPKPTPTSPKEQHDYIELKAARSQLHASGSAPTIAAMTASGSEQQLNNNSSDNNGTSSEEGNQSTKPRLSTPSLLEHAMYLSAAAILGASLRVYLGRLMGGDCEDNDDGAEVSDFLTPLSKQICITSNGRGGQNIGGVLFRDLPANILGSFVMGLVSSDKIKIPWFHQHHPIQQDALYHLTISTGFCGSLTTFAGWNSQMVVMIDGGMSGERQIVVALCGYLIGFLLPIAAFLIGRHVAVILYTCKHPENEGVVEEEEASDEHFPMQPTCCHPSRFAVLVAALAIIVLYIVGYLVYDIDFYQTMVVLLPLAPLGALTRWNLSTWNTVADRILICTDSFDWFPLGTWMANVVGAIISIACMAVLDRLTKLEQDDQNAWWNATILALAAGLAGSLSTVSSMVKEIVVLAEKNPGPIRSLLYVLITLVTSLAIGLVIYSLVTRIY